MLIAVEEGRDWITTQLAARALPVRVLLQPNADYEILRSREGLSVKRLEPQATE